jgi:nucleoid-associated protein YgaU
MASTDLCGSRKAHVHNRLSLRQPLRCGLSILICSCLFAGAAQCRARVPQDVAEAARQERARKEQQKKSKHVYTDDDLRRAKILTPEDQARVEARRELQPTPGEEQAQAPANGDEIAQLPLGDIARRYRNAKLAAQAPDPFHLPFDEPVFADPVISVPDVTPPRPSFAPAHPSVVAGRPTVVAAPAISDSAPSQLVPPIALARPARPATSFSAAHPNALPAARNAAVAPEITGVAPSGDLKPTNSVPKPGRPEGSFAATHPNVLARTPHAAVAPAIANALPSGSISPAISVPKPARPATNFSSAHPNVAPAQPGTVVAPPMPSGAPLRRLDPFTRRFAPAAPASAVRVAPPAAQPKEGLSVVPTGPISKASAPASAQPNVARTVAAPATAGKPSLSTHMVTVQPGDSLWKLAQQNLGRGSRWQELLAANPGIVDPTRIAAGTEIVIPAKATGLKSDLKVTVEQGDTLSKIAQLTYGRASAWRCIAQANPEIADANRIYKGQQLMLPFGCNDR